MSILLETHEMSKSFNGFYAVKDVNLRINEGDIHALIGPNGAGKTTCFNLLTKFLQPTSGKIMYLNNDITSLKPAQIARMGIVRSFQISAIFPAFTVIENITIALLRKSNLSHYFWRDISMLRKLEPQAIDILAEVGLNGSENIIASNLPYGKRRALEIATTIAMDPKVMLLDEPTQGMGYEDIQTVTTLIKKVSKGRTILMVEHNMDVIRTISDRITVMARGNVLAEGNYDEISKNKLVTEAYIGSTVD